MKAVRERLYRGCEPTVDIIIITSTTVHDQQGQVVRRLLGLQLTVPSSYFHNEDSDIATHEHCDHCKGK